MQDAKEQVCFSESVQRLAALAAEV
jgi:hypothetical protein